jgi:hypothetical protein
VTPGEFVQRFGVQSFYHFTDRRNLDSIRNVGAILRLAELNRRGIVIPAPGGNDWSHQADARRGLDEYVHLCLVPQHPMKYVARQERDIQETRFLGVATSILNVAGIRFAPAVANRRGVPFLTLDEAVTQMDFEVVYRRLDWRDPAIQARLKSTRKYELLVPADIPLQLVRGL